MLVSSCLLATYDEQQLGRQKKHAGDELEPSFNIQKEIVPGKCPSWSRLFDVSTEFCSASSQSQ